MTLRENTTVWIGGNGNLSTLLTEEVRRVGKISADGRPDRQIIEIGGTRGTVTVSEDWMELDFPAPPRRPRRPDRLLAANGRLGGNVRYVALGERAIGLRAEIPLGDVPRDGPCGVGELLRFTLSGLAHVYNGRSSQVPARKKEPAYADTNSTPTLSELCQEAGWEFSARADGQVHVSLDAPGGAFFQAAVTRDDGVTAIRMDPFLDGPPAQDVARRAVAALLLSISGSVRLVSAVSEPGGRAGPSGFAMGLRVLLPADAPAPVLDHALGALSSACQTCGQEVRALADDADMARHYLKIRHPWHLPRPLRGRRSPRRRGPREANGGLGDEGQGHGATRREASRAPTREDE